MNTHRNKWIRQAMAIIHAALFCISFFSSALTSSSCRREPSSPCLDTFKKSNRPALMRRNLCLYACVHVCIYVCMYVCMCAWNRTGPPWSAETCVCTRACMYAYMYVCMHVCTRVRTVVNEHLRICTHLHIQTHTYTTKHIHYDTGGLYAAFGCNRLGMTSAWRCVHAHVYLEAGYINNSTCLRAMHTHVYSKADYISNSTCLRALHTHEYMNWTQEGGPLSPYNATKMYACHASICAVCRMHYTCQVSL